jgi:Cyclic nucleotide-binding domain
MSWDRTGISRGLGGLASRFNGSRRRYEWLVQAFPHASAPLLVDATHRLRRTRYRRGDVIVAEGAPADRFYIVTSGEAEVIQRVETRDVHVCTFAPGQYFGEVGLLASRPRNAFAIIVRQSYVINFLGWVATRAPTPWPLRSDGCSGNGFTSVACTLALRLQERCGTARSWARSPTIWPGASLLPTGSNRPDSSAMVVGLTGCSGWLIGTTFLAVRPISRPGTAPGHDALVSPMASEVASARAVWWSFA